MVEGLSSIITGQPNEAHYRLYKRWADSRFGMIISGKPALRVLSPRPAMILTFAYVHHSAYQGMYASRMII